MSDPFLNTILAASKNPASMPSAAFSVPAILSLTLVAKFIL